MEKYRFNKFYHVFKNDTAVTEVSFNDFKNVAPDLTKEFQQATGLDEKLPVPQLMYSLLPEGEMYYGYELKTHAMEMAKAGALKHIAALIAEGPESKEKVYQYRFDHYEDLNVNLKDSAIRRLQSNVN